MYVQKRRVYGTIRVANMGFCETICLQRETLFACSLPAFPKTRVIFVSSREPSFPRMDNGRLGY